MALFTSLYPLVNEFLKTAGDHLTTSRVTDRWGYFSGGLFIFWRILKNSWKFMFTDTMIEAFWEPKVDEYAQSLSFPRKSICLGYILGLLVNSNVPFIEAKMQQLPPKLLKIFQDDFSTVLMQTEQFIQVSGMYMSGMNSPPLLAKEEGLKALLRVWPEISNPIQAAIALSKSRLPRLLNLYIGMDQFQDAWIRLGQAERQQFWSSIISENLECFTVTLNLLRPNLATISAVWEGLKQNHKCGPNQKCTADRVCSQKSQENSANLIMNIYSYCVIRRAKNVKSISRSQISVTFPSLLRKSNHVPTRLCCLQAFLLFTLSIPLDASFLSADNREPAMPEEFPQLWSFILKRYRACNPEFCKNNFIESVQVEFEDSNEVYTDKRKIIYDQPTFHK